jgi:hypothetical protein
VSHNRVYPCRIRRKQGVDRIVMALAVMTMTSPRKRFVQNFTSCLGGNTASSATADVSAPSYALMILDTELISEK